MRVISPVNDYVIVLIDGFNYNKCPNQLSYSDGGIICTFTFWMENDKHEASVCNLDSEFVNVDVTLRYETWRYNRYSRY